MSRLASEEAAEFRSIRAACYQGLDATELLALVGRRIQRFLGADAFCANEVDPATLLLTSAASEGWPIEARPLFLDHVYLRTPAADPARLLEACRSTADVHQVLARTVARATHTGALMGIPASGKQIAVPMIGLARIAEGKVAEWWNSPDQLGLMQQLGVVPAPSEAAR